MSDPKDEHQGPTVRHPEEVGTNVHEEPKKKDEPKPVEAKPEKTEKKD